MMGGAGHWSTWRRYIVYGLHLHSRNYVSALLAVFPKYRALKFTRAYISHCSEIFTCTTSNLHTRHTYLYMYIRNALISKLNIINSVCDTYKTRHFCHMSLIHARFWEKSRDAYRTYRDWLIIWRFLGLKTKCQRDGSAPFSISRRLHVTAIYQNSEI